MKKKYTKSKQSVQVETKAALPPGSNALTIWTNYVKYTTLASEKHAAIMSIQAVRSIGKDVYDTYATLNICAQVVYILLAVIFGCVKDYISIYIDQSSVKIVLFFLMSMSLIFWTIRFISVILYKKFTECCDRHIASCKEAYDTSVEAYMNDNV